MSLSPSTIHDPSTYSTGIGAYHIANNAANYEPQRSNTFKLIIPDSQLVDLIRPGDGSSFSGQNPSEQLELSISKTSVPSFSIDPISIKRGNSTVYYAGTPEYSAGSFTIHDYIGMDAKDILYAWQMEAYDPETEKIGLAVDYKKYAYLVEYRPDFEPVIAWKIQGMWVTEVKEDDFDNDANGNHMVTASFRYDRATIDRTFS